MLMHNPKTAGSSFAVDVEHIANVHRCAGPHVWNYSVAWWEEQQRERLSSATLDPRCNVVEYESGLVLLDLVQARSPALEPLARPRPHTIALGSQGESEGGGAQPAKCSEVRSSVKWAETDRRCCGVCATRLGSTRGVGGG